MAQDLKRPAKKALKTKRRKREPAKPELIYNSCGFCRGTITGHGAEEWYWNMTNHLEMSCPVYQKLMEQTVARTIVVLHQRGIGPSGGSVRLSTY